MRKWTRVEAYYAILKMLKRGPLSTSAISQRMGLAQTTVGNYLVELKNAGKIEQQGQSVATEWRLVK